MITQEIQNLIDKHDLEVEHHPDLRSDVKGQPGAVTVTYQDTWVREYYYGNADIALTRAVRKITHNRCGEPLPAMASLH
jgi:hypothetical protein